jgi:hypothetical protein
VKSLTFLLFAGSAVLVLMACAKADRVRAWRESVNPSAPPVGDIDFVIARVALLGMAALGIYFGFQSISVSKDAHWSNDELTNAVRSAADSLDGDSTYSPYEDDTPGDLGTGYALTIEDAIAQHVGSDAPRSAVDATPTSPEDSNEAYYNISAEGADPTFCMHVKVLRDKSGDYEAPGIAGGSPTQYKYVFKVVSSAGEC